MMEIIPYGDQAILINFEQKIDASINDEVIQLHEKLKSNLIKGITFCICLLYTSPSPRDQRGSRMPSSA